MVPGAAHWPFRAPPPSEHGGGAFAVPGGAPVQLAAFDFTTPEYPFPLRDPRGPARRFRCPAPGCGWFHDERLDTEPAEPLVIPLTSEAAIEAAITKHAEARQREIWERIHAACAAHVTAEHPEAAGASR